MIGGGTPVVVEGPGVYALARSSKQQQRMPKVLKNPPQLD